MKPDKYASVRQLGIKGWNSFDDPQDIDDRALADALNVVYDKGYPTPRAGSFLKWPKPDGEADNLLNLFQVRASDGTNYAVAAYGVNFYLRDEENDQWIKLNRGYTPSVKEEYGYANWNAGIGSDSFYACNGKESFVKWPIALGYLAANQSSSDTSLTLADGTKFPASGGSIIVKERNGDDFEVSYSSRTGNVLTLSAPLGHDVGAGSAVACEIDEAPSMEKGKIVAKFEGRLIVANGFGAESTLYGSEIGNPENFTPDTGIIDPFVEVITDGNGGIQGVDDFGEYLLVEKSDSSYKVAISINSDLDAKLITIVPVASDTSMGPINPQARIKKNNSLFYVTETEGIASLSPNQTGNSTQTGYSVISQPIQPFVTSLNFSKSRIAAFKQKILFSCARETANDTILVWDILRSAWSRFDNWPVADWLTHNKELLFGSTQDGAIYQAFHESNTDNNNPYEISFSTKRYDMGDASKPKTMSTVFVQGYVSEATKFNIDVLFNEDGELHTQTYEIDGTKGYVKQPTPLALAMMMLGSPIMGSGEPMFDKIGIFRVYLSIPARYGFYNIQLRAYSSQAAANWGITGIGFNPESQIKIPTELVINSVGLPVIQENMV